MFLLLFTNVELSSSRCRSWLKGEPPGTRTLAAGNQKRTHLSFHSWIYPDLKHTVSVSFWKMQFQSPKCKCWNLSQLSRQGYILGRFLLGFSQCNSRVPDWIPARCFEASLSRQNGFSSLIEPPSCLIWFLLKLLTYSAIISYKKAKVGARIGTKIGPRIGAKIGTRIGTQIGPRIGGPKRGPELKDPFCPHFRSLFWNHFRVQFWDQIWAGSNGTSCFNSTLKITVTVKEMTKATKYNWKIMQGQQQPSF